MLLALGLYFAVRHQQQRLIARQIQLLASESLRTREHAEETLVRIGRPAVPHLTLELAHGPCLIRERAAAGGRAAWGAHLAWLTIALERERVTSLHVARALGEIADPRAIPALGDFLDSGVAFLAGCYVGEGLEEKRRAELEDAGAEAIIALGKMRDQRAIPALVEPIISMCGRLQALAAEAVGRTGGATAYEAFMDVLTHERDDVRCIAIEALAGTGDPHVIRPIASLLDDKSTSVRNAAAKALLQAGGQAGLEMLVQRIRSAPGTTSFALAGVVASTRDPRALKALQNLAAQPPDTPGQRAAKNALYTLVKQKAPSRDRGAPGEAYRIAKHRRSMRGVDLGGKR